MASSPEVLLSASGPGEHCVAWCRTRDVSGRAIAEEEADKPEEGANFLGVCVVQPPAVSAPHFVLTLCSRLLQQPFHSARCIH